MEKDTATEDNARVSPRDVPRVCKICRIVIKSRKNSSWLVGRRRSALVSDHPPNLALNVLAGLELQAPRKIVSCQCFFR